MPAPARLATTRVRCRCWAHALRVTWQQCDGQRLTVAGYQRTGGIRQALATTADRAYTRLSPAEQQIARQVLLRLRNEEISLLPRLAR
jgi:hypothetical protein